MVLVLLFSRHAYYPCVLLDTRDYIPGISTGQLLMCICPMGRGILNVCHLFVANLRTSRHTITRIFKGVCFYSSRKRIIPQEPCKLPAYGLGHAERGCSSRGLSNACLKRYIVYYIPGWNGSSPYTSSSGVAMDSDHAGQRNRTRGAYTYIS